MILLPNVTLICVDGAPDSSAIFNSVKSLCYSTRNIKYNNIVLVSPDKISPSSQELIERFNITRFNMEPVDWLGYNNFILRNLKNFVHTEFCLIIQQDGFVLNPHLWVDEFLNYDYIGATWTDDMIQNSRWVHDSVKQNRKYSLVGNGGFSFRSKKLLELTSQAPFENNGPEDGYICQNNFDYFLGKGVKFAPIEIANKFSRESNKSLKFEEVFGFHAERDFINQITL